MGEFLGTAKPTGFRATQNGLTKTKYNELPLAGCGLKYEADIVRRSSASRLETMT